MGLLLGIAVTLLAVVGGQGNPPTAQKNASGSGLGLRVERQNDMLRIGWDSTLPGMAEASSAQLEIEDGKQRRRLQLSQEQLRQGSVTYAPGSDDVIFRLDARHRDGRQLGTDNLRFVWVKPDRAQSGKSSQASTPAGNATLVQGARVRVNNGQAVGKGVVVRGVIVRDTPVEVRVRVDKDGRLQNARGNSPLSSMGRKIKNLGSKSAGLLGF